MAGIWTRNYYNMLTAMFLGDTTASSSATPTDYSAPIRFRNVSGGYTSLSASSYGIEGHPVELERTGMVTIDKSFCKLMTNQSANINTEYFGVMFGSGTASATYDDYALQTPITSGISLADLNGALTQPSAYDSNTHHYSSERSFTFTNSSANAITVNEMGLYLPMFYTGSFTTGYPMLIYREVFDAPIALQPGESIILSLKRDGEVFNYTPY